MTEVSGVKVKVPEATEDLLNDRVVLAKADPR
jgi:hypothetical protein